MQVNTQKLLKVLKSRMADYEVENLSLRLIVADKDKVIAEKNKEIEKLKNELDRKAEGSDEEPEEAEVEIVDTNK